MPRAVGCLLAGICLWDALVIAVAGEPTGAFIALAGVGMTLVLQRYIAPT